MPGGGKARSGLRGRPVGEPQPEHLLGDDGLPLLTSCHRPAGETRVHHPARVKRSSGHPCVVSGATRVSTSPARSTSTRTNSSRRADSVRPVRPLARGCVGRKGLWAPAAPVEKRGHAGRSVSLLRVRVQPHLERGDEGEGSGARRGRHWQNLPRVYLRPVKAGHVCADPGDVERRPLPQAVYPHVEILAIRL